MKHLNRKYFNEALNQSQIQPIIDFIKNEKNNFGESDINNILKMLSRYSSEKNVNKESFDEYFKVHGLDKLNWGRNNTATDMFVKVFNDNDKIDALVEIVNNTKGGMSGMLDINDLKGENNECVGNIFDLCKDPKYVKTDFSDVAKIISSWKFGRSSATAVGPCELLLKFLLKGGCSSYSGDVSIVKDGKTYEMEVKTMNVGKTRSSDSGGHAAGQKTNKGEKIRGAWSIYMYLNEYLFDIEPNRNNEADNAKYFQNDSGFKKFIELLKEYLPKKGKTKDEQIEFLSKTLINALCFQYNFISNVRNSDNNLLGETPNISKDKITKLNKEVIKFFENNDYEKINFKDMLNIVGCIQLFLYSQVEGFDYIFVVALNSANSKRGGDGNYFLIPDCQESISNILNFEKILDNLSFGVLDSPTSTQGRTGKIYLEL